MSDLRQIIEQRKAVREAAGSPEWRTINATEQIADSLEGVRQDLTAMQLLLGKILEALNRP